MKEANMKLDEQILDLEGKPLTKQGSSETMTVRYAARSALIQPPKQAIPLDDSVRRYELQHTLHINENPKLKAEDIVLIKNCVAEVFGPLVVGQVVRVLEP